MKLLNCRTVKAQEPLETGTTNVKEQEATSEDINELSLKGERRGLTYTQTGTIMGCQGKTIRAGTGNWGGGKDTRNGARQVMINEKLHHFYSHSTDYTATTVSNASSCIHMICK